MIERFQLQPHTQYLVPTTLLSSQLVFHSLYLTIKLDLQESFARDAGTAWRVLYSIVPPSHRRATQPDDLIRVTFLSQKAPGYARTLRVRGRAGESLAEARRAVCQGFGRRRREQPRRSERRWQAHNHAGRPHRRDWRH